MRLWLIVLGCLLTPATAGQAQMLAGKPLIPRDDTDSTPRVPNLRLIQQPEFGPTPIRQSGMILDTQVTSNGTLGVGLFKVTPRKPNGGEWRAESRAPSSRKLGVSFKLRF